MKGIPEWQYPLYEEWDRRYYKLIEKLAKNKKYPKIIGEQEDINIFLKTMIRAQKMKDWRTFFEIIQDDFKKETFNIKRINGKSKHLEIPKGIEDWVIFDSDKRICELNDKIGEQKIAFEGNEKEIFEFILRFIGSQFLFNWQTPLMAVFLEIEEKERVRVNKLNDLLKIWDYTKIFE